MPSIVPRVPGAFSEIFDVVLTHHHLAIKINTEISFSPPFLVFSYINYSEFLKSWFQYFKLNLVALVSCPHAQRT